MTIDALHQCRAIRSQELTQANRYAYVAGDAINALDQTGLCLIDIACGAQKTALKNLKTSVQPLRAPALVPFPDTAALSFLRIRSARAREWAAFVAWTGFVVALALVTRDVGFVVVLGISYGTTLAVFVLARMVARRRRNSRQPPDNS